MPTITGRLKRPSMPATASPPSVVNRRKLRFSGRLQVNFKRYSSCPVLCAWKLVPGCIKCFWPKLALGAGPATNRFRPDLYFFCNLKGPVREAVSRPVPLLLPSLCRPPIKLLYWERRTKLIFENVIVDTVSTNICPLRGTYLYVNWHTKLKCINIFVKMVTHSKNNSQWAHSVTTLLLTLLWDYCTRNSQMAHAIPQYIATNKLNFEYKLYKLFAVLGVTN